MNKHFGSFNELSLWIRGEIKASWLAYLRNSITFPYIMYMSSSFKVLTEFIDMRQTRYTVLLS